MAFLKKEFNRRSAIEYFAITIGAIIMSAGIALFLVDAKVVPGGVTGLSMAVYYLTDGALPVGLLMWMFNIPLFIWGIIELGPRFGMRTFYGFSINSLFVDLFRGEVVGLEFIQLHKLPSIQYLLHEDFLLLILCGATLLGIGLGIIFKFKGTTAGSDIVAAILQKRYQTKPGFSIFVTDSFVIIFAGVVIWSMGLSPDKPALALTIYAFLLLFVSSTLINVILDGFDYARSVMIISDKNPQIADAIMRKMSRGATAIKGRGLYRNVDREIIMTVVTKKEIRGLTELVSDIDPDAFVIVNNVFEVLGQGFRRRV